MIIKSNVRGVRQMLVSLAEWIVLTSGNQDRDKPYKP